MAIKSFSSTLHPTARISDMLKEKEKQEGKELKEFLKDLDVSPADPQTVKYNRLKNDYNTLLEDIWTVMDHVEGPVGERLKQKVYNSMDFARAYYRINSLLDQRFQEHEEQIKALRDDQ